MIIVSTFLSIIFFILSFIHFYWAVGGKRWLDKAIPFDNSSTLIFYPGKTITLCVGLILFFVGVVFLLKSISTDFNYISEDFVHKFNTVLAFLFSLRAIGDFKYVGITKKIVNTEFSKWDSLLYIPLCIFVTVLTLYMNYGE